MLLSMAYEPEYNNIIGLGHATHGSNPDYTYDHYGKFEKENLVGFGDWTVNEQRSLMEQEQVYLKLVEYRRDILKVPDNKTKVVPWNELKDYLAVYNAIPENLNPEQDKGSLDSVIRKIKFLQDLLNGESGTQTIYKYNPDKDKRDNKEIDRYSFQTQWAYKNKDGGGFRLWDGLTVKGVSGYFGAGKDGYSVPQALSNRIDVFKELTDQQMKAYKNVIWDSSVAKYKSKDPEKEGLEKKVQNYSLSTIGVIKKLFGNQNPFVIKGNPPVAAQK